MDLFQEARWTFSDLERVGYYRNVIQDSLIAPRLPRFGVLTTTCTDQCLALLAYRTNPQALGLDIEPNPLGLFADVGNMEYNDPCRICVEAGYTATIEQLYANIAPGFGALQQQVQGAWNALPDTEENQEARAQLQDISTKLGTLIATVTKEDVDDFYSYYVARGLYGNLGLQGYKAGYNQFGELIGTCQALNLTCPPSPDQVDDAAATAALLNHADNVFSSVTASGAPFPFWSEPDGTGSLFGANQAGILHPVSGSGVDMSAPIESLTTYFRFLQTSGSLVDPNSPEWQASVETNPLYAWFMANLTPADEGTGTICGT